MRYSIICIMFIALLATYAQANPVMMRQLETNTERLLSLVENRKNAPKSSWNPLTSTQSDHDKRISDLLDNMLSILLDDSIIEMKNRINRLKEDNIDSERIISKLMTRRLSAPQEKSWHEVFTTTRSELDQRIASEREKIADRENEMDNLHNEIKLRLRDEPALKGMSDDQLYALVTSVMGEAGLELIVVLKNKIMILDILRNNLAESGENIFIVEKYAAMYYLMALTYVHQHDIVLNRHDSIFVPELRSIIAENRKLMEDTRKQAGKDRGFYKLLNSQRVTDETAQLYMKHLQNQRARLVQSRERAARVMHLAETNLRTVKIAQRLGQVMQESQRAYEELFALQIPELLLFENKAMEQEFQNITDRLQQAARR